MRTEGEWRLGKGRRINRLTVKGNRVWHQRRGSEGEEMLPAWFRRPLRRVLQLSKVLPEGLSVYCSLCLRVCLPSDNACLASQKGLSWSPLCKTAPPSIIPSHPWFIFLFGTFATRRCGWDTKSICHTARLKYLNEGNSPWPTLVSFGWIRRKLVKQPRQGTGRDKRWLSEEWNERPELL